MSNQGNIRLQTDESPDLLFTTGRWGGSRTPFIVQEALSDSLTGGNVIESTFIWNLSRHEEYTRPIRHLGNTDTPTVIVNFAYQTVTLFREHDRGLLTMPILDFVKEDLKNNKWIQENYE